MLAAAMKSFEANLPKIPMVRRIYLVGRWKWVNGVHGLHKLGQLWAHGATSMRRNHVDCWAQKNEYKKLGHKRPGLRTGYFFVIFHFLLGMPELKDKPEWLRTLLLLPALLYSFPNLGKKLKAGSDGWGKMWTMGREEVCMAGQDEVWTME